MMTKKEFWVLRAEPVVKAGVRAGAVFAFFSAGVTLIAALAAYPPMLLDVLVGAGLGTGLLVAKSRACAVILMVHFLVSKLIQIQMGQFESMSIPFALLFVAGYAYAIYGTFQFQKAFRQYLNSGGEEEGLPPQM